MSTLREAGEKLVEAAEREFPPLSTRCLDCGFRPGFHHSMNHPYRPPTRTFVEALREFVKQVSS